MSTTVIDLERTVNSGLTTTIKKSEINFEQLFIHIDIENLISLSNGNIIIANYNSNKQTIISGNSNDMDNTISYCKKNKIKGVIPLNVSGAFHSPLMEDARISFRKIINSTKFNDVKIPVYQNHMAEKNIKGHKIKNNLIYQLTYDSVETTLKK